MTAIAGIWRFDGRPDADACTKRMLAAQAIYGPHDCAQWSDETVGVGRQLYRLLPEDCYDRGPALSASGRFALAADIRIDNREELTGMLGIRADCARSMCDADVLLAAFERWDEAAVDRIEGDFAFAVWDAKCRRLVLARDFLGCRPLHYHLGADFLAFASMPKGLHALAEIPRAPDAERAAEFLACLPSGGGRGFFKGVECVEGGHIVTVASSGVSARRYWNPSRRSTALKRPEDYVDGLRHHLDTAVRRRLRGTEGRVGAHLSAGLDSSAVAATAARILGPSGGLVTAFTAVPRQDYEGAVPGRAIGDEGPLAALTAAMHPNIEHVQIRGEARSPFEALDRNVLLYERPLLNICNGVWLSAINDAARARGLTVVLNGQMGNLSISYNGTQLLAELFSAGRWLALFGELRAARAQGRGWKGLSAETVFPFLPALLRQWVNRFRSGDDQDGPRHTGVKAEVPMMLNQHRLARRREAGYSSRRWRDGFSMRLWGLRRSDTGNHNKGILGGWGIDQRDPTADKRLVEFCLSLPTGQFLFNGMPRSLARRALADRVPGEVLEEPRRGYQAADWHEGLTASRQAAAEEIDRLLSCGAAAEILDLAGLRALIDNWPSGGWERETVVQPYRVELLRAISVGHFLRKTSSDPASVCE